MRHPFPLNCTALYYITHHLQRVPFILPQLLGTGERADDGQNVLVCPHPTRIAEFPITRRSLLQLLTSRGEASRTPERGEGK